MPEGVSPTLRANPILHTAPPSEPGVEDLEGHGHSEIAKPSLSGMRSTQVVVRAGSPALKTTCLAL